VEMAEAGWSTIAQNPSSGAYGIAQFINGPGEYAQYGGSSGSASGQIAGFLDYIIQRYGNPEAAWAHEQAFHWYDQGGLLMPGLTMAMNATGKPERVIPAGAGEGLGGGQIHAEIHVHLDGKELFNSMQKQTFQYDIRNNGGGGITGAMRPK
jgi:SLT domain-containing protein